MTKVYKIFPICNQHNFPSPTKTDKIHHESTTHKNTTSRILEKYSLEPSIHENRNSIKIEYFTYFSTYNRHNFSSPDENRQTDKIHHESTTHKNTTYKPLEKYSLKPSTHENRNSTEKVKGMRVEIFFARFSQKKYYPSLDFFWTSTLLQQGGIATGKPHPLPP